MKLLKNLSLLLVLLAALALRIYFFDVSIHHLPTSSDEALAQLIAKSIAQFELPLLFWGTPYQFPLESYLSAPFYSLLPNSALGARLLLAVLGSCAMLGFILCALIGIIQKPSAATLFIAVLLFGFPSAYILSLQAAYFIPQYTATANFAWVLPFLLHYSLRNGRSRKWPIALGFFSGLALSTHLLSIPLVAATICCLLLSKSFKNARGNISYFAPSFLLGLLPYLITLPQASQQANSVTGSHSLSEAVQRFFSPLISTNLSTVLGITGTVFPDFGQWQGDFPWLITPVLTLFWLILLSCTLMRLWTLAGYLRNKTWPQAISFDVFLLSSWASLFAFAFSTRSQINEFRYLLPVGWAFPFLLLYLYMQLKDRLRLVLVALVLGLSLVNIRHSLAIAHTWKDSGFALRSADLPDISPVQDYLALNNITHCYSGFWYAYRFTFASDELLLCDQAFNERFHGWPLPYRRRIDASDSVAYVLSNSWGARFRADHFKKWLDWHRLEAIEAHFFPFVVFHSFRYRDVKQSTALREGKYRLSVKARHMPENIAAFEDMREEAELSISMDANEEIELLFALTEPAELHRLRLLYSGEKVNESVRISVSSSSDGQVYSPIRSDFTPAADRLMMAEHFPIIRLKPVGNAQQDVSFAPRAVRALRLRIKAGSEKTSVSFSDIVLFTSQLPGSESGLELFLEP